MKNSVLIIDDEPDMLKLLKRILESELDCIAQTASSAESALKILKKSSFDLILLDIKMPGMDGLTLLKQLKDKNPALTILMLTAYGDTETIVDAMKRGAYDFITKPFDHEALVVRIEKALERSKLLKDNQRLKKECSGIGVFENFAGESIVMKNIYESVRTIAKTDLTVLITGDSGTGKSQIARAIHGLSRRNNENFVAVNCPTVPENILESELFGYKKGAFTHAVSNKIGLFQEANRGTIFLDEIGEINTSIQTKLLHVLQEKQIKPLGDTKSINVDVQIIASTNQNLEELIKEGKFREDFFYRLNVLPIRMPSLKEHPEDIPILVDHLLKKHSIALNKTLKKLTPELMCYFMQKTWKGNIREMENLIMQGIVFSTTDEIAHKDVGFSGGIDTQINGLDSSIPETQSANDNAYNNLAYKDAKEMVLTLFNKNYIAKLLSNSTGNVTQAAKACGLERQSLQQIMKRYGIKPDDFRG